MSAELDPESGAETATEAALLERRPRSGPEYERALVGARANIDLLVMGGKLTEAEATRAAETLLNITWLAAEGYISREEMSARTVRLANRHIARLRAKGVS